MPAPASRIGSLRARAPALAVFAAGLTLAGLDGGYPPAVWYLAALFVLGLLVLSVALAPPAPHERSRLFEAALGGYAAFCVWSYISIAWAQDAGSAWEGANRNLLYGIVLALVGLRPWTRDSARLALSLVAVGTAAIAAGVLVLSVVIEDPARLFLEGRLSAPTGYANATAALWLIALWPALELASGAGLRWPVRALGLASASLLLEMAVLSQSRGAAIAFLATAPAFVAMTRRRGPVLLALAFVCSAAAAASGPLLAVHEARSAAEIGPALAGARTAIGATLVVAFLAVAAVGLAGRRLAAVARRRWIVTARRLALAAMIAAVAGSGALAVGNPWSWADARWRDFKTAGYRDVETGGSRFSGSLGSNRYDFYRVAVNEFRRHPVAGIGADNFAAPYLAQRRSGEAPRYPHSLGLGLISQLGAVGAAMFLLFLTLALACAGGAIRRAPTLEGSLAASATAGFACWLVHGMVDWLWELPGLGVMAFALLGLSARLDDGPARPAQGAGLATGGIPGALVRRGAAAAVVFAMASFALPAAAARLQREASQRAATDPAGALARFQVAGDLNFLSSEPLTAGGVVARRRGMTRRAREALERALEREPENWYVQLQLGLLDEGSRRPASARKRIAAAARLNPRQPVLHAILRRLKRGSEVDERAVERELYEQGQAKLRPVRAVR